MARTRYMLTVGDYRTATPEEVGRFTTVEQAEAALGRRALAGEPVAFPQLFALKVGWDDGDILDSKRLSPDWAQIEADASGVPDRFMLAPRAASHGGFLHTCNGTVRSGLPFGRKNPDECARCWEMVNGAPARTPEWTEHLGATARREAAISAEMRAHFAAGGPHATGRCGPVCTAFDS